MEFHDESAAVLRAPTWNQIRRSHQFGRMVMRVVGTFSSNTKQYEIGIEKLFININFLCGEVEEKQCCIN